MSAKFCDNCEWVTTQQASFCPSCGEELLSPLEKTVSFKDLLAHLDQYVIGQELPKKHIANILYNHHLKSRFNLESKDLHLDKTNVLIVGDSGCGKTHTIKAASKFLEIPITIQDATAYSSAGYIGRDIESMLSDLYVAAGHSIEKMKTGIIYIDEVDKLAANGGNGPDVGGKGVQQGLLKLIESATVMFPENPNDKQSNMLSVDTSNILIIASGAFNGMASKKGKGKKAAIGFDTIADTSETHVTQDDLIKYGMMAEFVGRMGSLVQMDKMTKELMRRIFSEPKESLLEQYQKLYVLRKEEWPLVEADYDAIIEASYESPLGARALRFAIESKLLEKINVDTKVTADKATAS